jgi:hypothetical protein
MVVTLRVSTVLEHYSAGKNIYSVTARRRAMRSIAMRNSPFAGNLEIASSCDSANRPPRDDTRFSFIAAPYETVPLLTRWRSLRHAILRIALLAMTPCERYAMRSIAMRNSPLAGNVEIASSWDSAISPPGDDIFRYDD